MILIYGALALIFVPLLVGLAALVLTADTTKNHSDQIPVLLFHAVTETDVYNQSHITSSLLQQFCKHLIHTNTIPVTAQEAAFPSRAAPASSTKHIALVFDDGFENFYTCAFPILEEYNIRSTIFPVVHSLDTHATWDVYSPQKQLSKQQLRAIADAGHEIGSHTLTHPALALLPDKELLAELSKSKKVLEEICNKPVLSISFPFGSWDQRVWQFAQECGYTTAVAYRFPPTTRLPVLRATGVYAFDTLQDIIDKSEGKLRYSNARTRGYIMPHFAKGTPVWKFRKNYDIMRLFQHPEE